MYLRLIVGTTSVVCLILVFVFQHFNFAGLLSFQGKPLALFIVNRTIRFFLNDAFAIALIWALFYRRKYVIFAIWVQIFGLVFFLIPYFVLKTLYPSYNGPLISFMHRLVLNPTLLLLLIPAFYYQLKSEQKKDQTR